MQAERANRLAIWLIALLGFASVGSLQQLSDRSGATLKTQIKRASILNSEPAIPSVSALRLLSLGNPTVMADILWLKTIQYFGSGNPYGDYPSLGKMLDVITQLDAPYEYPYQFGLVVLPYMKQADTAVMLGERDQRALPGRGLLTYYLATDYHLNLHDYKKAAEYYQKAATEPGAPAAASTLAGVTLSQLDGGNADRIVAREFWRTVYEHAQTQDEKDQAEKWFNHMDLVYNLELAAAAYKEKTGRYPSSQEDMVQAGITKQVYESPIGRDLVFNPETGRISFDTLASGTIIQTQDEQ